MTKPHTLAHAATTKGVSLWAKVRSKTNSGQGLVYIECHVILRLLRATPLYCRRVTFNTQGACYIISIHQRVLGSNSGSCGFVSLTTWIVMVQMYIKFMLLMKRKKKKRKHVRKNYSVSNRLFNSFKSFSFYIMIPFPNNVILYDICLYKTYLSVYWKSATQWMKKTSKLWHVFWFNVHVLKKKTDVGMTTSKKPKGVFPNGLEWWADFSSSGIQVTIWWIRVWGL